MDEATTQPADPASVARRAHRFSKEFLATIISLVTTAFGVVVALAWNEALTTFFKSEFSPGGAISALFGYALIITVIGVLVIVSLGKASARLDAEPIEFKYQKPPGTQQQSSG